MDLAAWRALALSDPAAAARTVLARAATLAPDQQRAIWAVPPAEARLTAALAASAQRGGPLAGVPYALKDLFHVAGLPTLAGGTFLDAELPRPRKDGAVVEALAQAGAVLAGKTHLHEYAYGLTGENPHHGAVAHPRDATRTSGGSSSGSAAAVAAGIVPLAVGTDTGGSIRVPAAFCGLYGLRLTPHHAWIADGFPLAPSFDTAGFFTAHARDLAEVMRALGIGANLPSTPDRAPRGCFLPLEALVPDADPAFCAALTAAAERLAPRADVTTTAQLTQAFAGSGAAYGVLQSTEAYAVHTAWLDRRQAEFDPAVWARIDRGRRWPADTLHAAQVRAMIVRLTCSAYFQRHDFLVLPATHAPALAHTDCTQVQRDRLLTLTTPASLAGLPVLTLPVALPATVATAVGLTGGLQIIVPAATSAALPWALAQT